MRKAERIITEANLPGLAEEYRRRVFLDNDLILYIYEARRPDDEVCEARQRSVADVSGRALPPLSQCDALLTTTARTNNIDGFGRWSPTGRHARLTTNIREVNGKFVWAGAVLRPIQLKSRVA